MKIVLMKIFSLITVFLGMAVCQAESADSQEVIVPAPAAEKGKGEKSAASEDRPRGSRHGRPPFGREMNEDERKQFLYFHHLFMERYDKNKNGRLDPEEMEEMKVDAEKFRNARREMILKRFDKNGDGKLDEEEKAGMKKVLREEMEKRLEKRREQKEKEGEKEPGKQGEKGENRGKDKNRPGQRQAGPPPEAGYGPRPGKPREGAPAEVIMIHGHHLMMEKFDKDKDGKLSEEELKAMKEDREAFFKKWEEGRKKWRARRAAMKEDKKDAGASE